MSLEKQEFFPAVGRDKAGWPFFRTRWERGAGKGKARHPNLRDRIFNSEGKTTPKSSLGSLQALTLLCWVMGGNPTDTSQQEWPVRALTHSGKGVGALQKLGRPPTSAAYSFHRGSSLLKEEVWESSPAKGLYLHYISVAVIKHFEKSNLRKKGFILLYSSISREVQTTVQDRKVRAAGA